MIHQKVLWLPQQFFIKSIVKLNLFRFEIQLENLINLCENTGMPLFRIFVDFKVEVHADIVEHLHLVKWNRILKVVTI